MLTHRFVSRIGFWLLLVLLVQFGAAAPVVADPGSLELQTPLPESPLTLPTEANSLADLAPSHLPRISATAFTIPPKANLEAESGLLTSAGATMSFFKDQVAVIADTNTVTDSVRISLGYAPLPAQSTVAYEGGLVSNSRRQNLV